jgi:hypothetical protein
MSNRKQSKKNGSGDEEEDPKHPNNDPRTNVTQTQTEKMKKLGLGNRKESTLVWNQKDSKSARKRKAKKAKKELRRRARQNEPVVEPGNEIQNEVLESVSEGKNRVESPVPSSSSQSGSDDDSDRKAGSSSSQNSQSGESQSGSDDEKSDDEFAKLRKEAENDEMCVTLDRREAIAPQVQQMKRCWVGTKPGPLSSKPCMSKTMVEPSTSEAIVEPSTSEATKRSRFEVDDWNLLCDSSSPKIRRVTRARMDEEESLREKARQADEVSRKHKRRIQEPETLRVGKANDPNRPAKKVNSDHAKLNMQKKADGKRISESEAINRLYREVRIWNDGDPSHGSGNFQEKQYQSIPVRSERGRNILTSKKSGNR